MSVMTTSGARTISPRVRWSRESCRMMRPAMAGARLGTALTSTADIVEESVLQTSIGPAGALAQLFGRTPGDDPSCPHEGELVTVGGVVHGVRRDDEGDALAGEQAEVLPEGDPELRLSPTVGLSRKSRGGACTMAQARLTRCLMPPLRFATESRRLSQRSTNLMTSSILAAAFLPPRL